MSNRPTRAVIPPPVQDSGDAKVGVASIVEGNPLNSGEPTYRAEIYVVMNKEGELNHTGKLRTMCIRGPSRQSQDIAQEDGRRMEEAAPGGPKAVRAVSVSLHR